MNRYSIVDKVSGRILKVGSTSKTADVPKDNKDTFVLHEALDAENYFIDPRTGRETERPNLGLVESVEGEVSVEKELGWVPPGTQVRIDKVHAGVFTGGNLLYKPLKAEQIEIDLIPPFPYKPTTIALRAGRAQLEELSAQRLIARRRWAEEMIKGLT